MSVGRAGVVAVLVIAGAATPRNAVALTPADWALRHELIEDARAAHNSGDHTKALLLSQKAAALQTSPSLTYFIARENEETGALADGFALAQQCALEAERDTKLRERQQIMKQCHEIADRLERRVGRIVVEVKDPPPGLHVKISGHDLNDVAIGRPYQVTPGAILVEATAPDHKPYRSEIAVSQGALITVPVTLVPEAAPSPPLIPCPPGQRRGPDDSCTIDSCPVGMIRTGNGVQCCWPGQAWDESIARCAGAPRCPAGMHVVGGESCSADEGVPARTMSASAQEKPEVALQVKSASRPPRRVKASAVAVAAVGAAALAAGGVVWLISSSHFDALKAVCDKGCASADRQSKISDVQSLDKWSAGLAVSGGVMVGGAALLQWALPSRETAYAHLAFDPSRGTVWCEGRF